MRKWWLLILMSSLSWQTFAQNDIFFGHYMFNPTHFNPAWAGSESTGFVAAQHRTQWLGYGTTFDGNGGAPSSQQLTAVVPIRNFFVSSVGLVASNDQLGALNNVQVQLPVSYTIERPKSTWILGLAPAIYSQTLRFDQLRFNDASDPLNIGSRETQIQPNLSAGAFYENKNDFFVGVGATNLLRPGFDFGQDSLTNKQAIHYYAHAGKSFSLSDEIGLTPTVLARTNLGSYTFDIGAIVTLKGKAWTGISYRYEESIILFLGYSLLDNRLRAGYSFDYVIQNRTAKAATSHELFLRYDLPELVFGGKKVVKTPRFSF
ncbi:PorP/SprF family type IX secretion system membrane protein [Marinoscillum furvescens]|uniref:Type IX secretion system PorP/SprF family membrane protein n=1 Tax=Marinoscillum furvescens DSM 4134 TaxID=1122208 RepID=A0A3D9L4F9_MARFU|nr:type IX secretion system membrane protein PorP/SprF [Marinoscillum furvescens]REE00493.1 type IX secretion system PorP/SprF family membrane protein [Marinoscillum furvescens DSM 4134]